MEIDLRRKFPKLDKPSWTHWGVFSSAMDAYFVLPFDCRRITPWRRSDKTTFWCYVTLPEKK